MRTLTTILAILLACALGAIGQDSAPLGDVARKVRREHSSPAHNSARQVTNEEDDGPDVSGVWRLHLCPRIPCHELSVILPKTLKWKRAAEEPRPVLISLPDKDSPHIIRVYAAGVLEPQYPFDPALRTFLQGWFAKPEYFGQAARIVHDENFQLDGYAAVMSHFTITASSGNYRGVSIVARSPNGNYGFACVFREEDSAAATSICDAIVKSAKNQLLQPAPPPQVQPDPPSYDPPDDPPNNRRVDDPQQDPQQDDPQ